jgi:hypothetical protein
MLLHLRDGTEIYTILRHWRKSHDEDNFNQDGIHTTKLDEMTKQG